jgi:DNA-binding IclR family transcriptional regulator
MTSQQLRAEQRLDHFAELLSQDIPLHDIAERLGVRTARASQLLMKLRARLGPQAV